MNGGGRNTLLPSLTGWLHASGDTLPEPDLLSPIGFLNLHQAALALRRLGRGPAGEAWRGAERDIAAGLAGSADPDQALASLERFSEAAEPVDVESVLGHLGSLLMILGASPFLGDVLIRSPGLTRWLFLEKAIDVSASEGIAIADLTEWSAQRDVAELVLQLNRWKRTELLRIGARSVTGLSTLEEEFEALSQIADNVLEVLLECLWPADIPIPAVMALGKLGGRELNFSSDIDLIFVLPHDEKVELSTALPAAGRAVETMVKALTDYTAEGSLYRVDLRLRPGGERAPLIRTTRGIEGHYSARGAPWERQMLVKARICAGDRQAGNSLLKRLEPFVYPAHAEADPREEAHRHRRERRAREGIAPVTEHFPMDRVNDAMEHLRAGKARYRIVLDRA